MLFLLSLQPIVLEINKEAPSLTQNAWFLDDGDLGGNKESLQIAVDIIKREGPSRGLVLSETKSKVWIQGDHQYDSTDPLDRGIPLDTAEGIRVLGAPIGSTSFEEDVILERIVSTEVLMEKLGDLEDPHSEYVLLKNCFSLQKLSYIMRTVDTGHHETLMRRFNSAVRSTMERILGSPMNEDQ